MERDICHAELVTRKAGKTLDNHEDEGYNTIMNNIECSTCRFWTRNIDQKEERSIYGDEGLCAISRYGDDPSTTHQETYCDSWEDEEGHSLAEEL